MDLWGDQEVTLNEEIEIPNEEVPIECQPCFDESEEGRKAKSNTVQNLPSQSEIDEHMLTHVPFRSWCRFCVMGKSVAAPHRRVDKSDETIPTVSIDYAFLNEKQEVDTREDSGMPILVIKDRKSGMMQSRVVPAKGNDKFAIKRLVQEIELLGYTKVIIKRTPNDLQEWSVCCT